MRALVALVAGVLSSTAPALVSAGMAERTADDAPGRVLVVMTYAQLGWAGRASFIQSSIRIAGKLPSVPGVVVNDQGIRWLGSEVWTISAWRTEKQMMDFLYGPDHGRAMREDAVAIREIKTFRLHCTSDAVPMG